MCIGFFLVVEWRSGNLKRILIVASRSLANRVSDPDPTFHENTDPGPGQNYGSGSYPSMKKNMIRIRCYRPPFKAVYFSSRQSVCIQHIFVGKKKLVLFDPDSLFYFPSLNENPDPTLSRRMKCGIRTES